MIDLKHGNCLDLMKDIPDASIDMILCDLPYGTTACKWDTVIPFDEMWEQYKRIIKANGAIVLCATQPFTSKLIASNYKMFRYSHVWDKGKASNFMSAQLMPLLRTEDIVVFSKATCNCMSKLKMVYNPQGLIRIDKEVANGKNVGGKVAEARAAVFTEGKTYKQEFTNYPFNVINIANDNNKLHPTQKPVALLEYLIKTYTLEGETVLDNCMGSGSTGIACLNTGRNFIGIEMDNTYFEVAKNRIENHK